MKPHLVCLIALLLYAPHLLAQKWEVAPTYSFFRPGRAPLGSLPGNTTVRDRDTKIKAGPAYGVRVTRNTPGYYGFEGAYQRSRHTLTARITPSGAAAATRESKIDVEYASFNFLSYFMPAGEWWRPFFTAGVHTQRYGEPKFSEWTQGPTRTYGANVGGGIKLKLFKNALVRLEFRDYIGGKPYDLTFQDETKLGGGLFHTLEASVGISIAF